jgi:hypothetical protein
MISQSLKINVATTDKDKLTEKVFEDIKNKLKENYIYPEDM